MWFEHFNLVYDLVYSFISGIVYYFPIAAVTNYHKFSGFEKHKFIILQL